MKKRIIIITLALLLTVVSFAIIPLTKDTSEKVKTVIAEVKERVENTRTISYLQEEFDNKDIIGTLAIPGTGYETLVMQSKDNTYYLRKDANKKYSRGGTPFLDYRVEIGKSKKLLIYGHNSKYVDMPFKILENYYDEEYYKNHKYITLTTTNGTYKYEIFSIYVEPSNWSYLNVDFKNEKEYANHIKMLKDKSLIDTGVEVSSNDEILILQTCSTKKEYQKYKKKFLLIVSRKVEG